MSARNLQVVALAEVRVVALLLVLAGCRPSQPPCSPTAARGSTGQEQVDATLPVFPRPEAARVSRRYATSFETLDEFSDFYLVPQNYLGTSSHELSSAVVHSGERAHRGWMDGWNDVTPGTNTNHRAYPAFELFKRGEPFADLVRVELWVWLDAVEVAAGPRRRRVAGDGAWALAREGWPLTWPWSRSV